MMERDMKTLWQIVESPHEEGPIAAIRRSRFINMVLPQEFKLDVVRFTDVTVLVVVTVLKRGG
jgi:hypothetical protein